MSKANKHYGVISKRLRWGLTIWGWLAILLVLILLLILLFSRSYSILAPDRPVKARVLVIEGAVPDYMLDSAMAEFNRNHYQLLITTGTPLEWGHLLVQYGNTANVAAATLKRMGFDSTRLVAIATNEIQNDRTYNSALALGAYLRKYHPDIHAINLMSYGPHARRSQIMFQEALGNDFKVGIISIKSFYYDKNNWWRSSKGFREVMNELLGFVFVKFFFVPYHPDDKPTNEPSPMPADQ